MKSLSIHYAWIVLIGCTLTFFTMAGLNINVFSVYSPFIMEQHGFSKTEISMITSINSLAATCSVFLTTLLYKKLSLRNGMLFAGLLNASAYVFLAMADSLPAYLFASCLRGLAFGLGSMVPIAKLIDNWFLTGRTFALSIVSAASGLATLGFPSLITWIIQRYSMRISFLVSAAAFALLYLICWLLIRDDPAEMGLSPYEGKEKEKTGEKQSQEHSYRPLDSRWWVLCSAALLASTCCTACFYALSMLSSTEGMKPEAVALVVSVSGASLMVGKLLFGAVSTSAGLKKSSLVFGLFGVLGLTLCCLVRVNPAFLFAGTALLGLTVSMIVVGSVAWITDWAKPEERPEHVKVFQSVYNLGVLIFGFAAGIAADLSKGSYIPFYAASAVIALCFTVFVQLVYRWQEQ